MDRVTIVKLGGSAITDKAVDCTPNIPVIQHVGDQLADYRLPLVLIHGGGSYAHPFVTRSGIAGGLRDQSQLRSISETEFYLGQLTRIICASLLLRNMNPVPLHPMSFATLSKGEIKSILFDPIRSSLEAGLTPLLHGDLVFDESRGIGVLSGDRVASLIGKELGASRVLFGCDVDGIYSANPKNSPKAALISEVNSENFQSVMSATVGPSNDATGGMEEKVKQALRLARHGCECYIFNLREKNALSNILDRKGNIGTRFVPWNKSRKSVKQSLQRA